MEQEQEQVQELNDLGRFESGKYLYRLDDGSFDINRFNRDFDQYIDRRKSVMSEMINKKFDELNRPVQEVPIYDLSVGTILLNTKNVLFNILDDLLQGNIRNVWDVFIREHRLFYIGIFLLIIAALVYLYLIFAS